MVAETRIDHVSIHDGFSVQSDWSEFTTMVYKACNTTQHVHILYQSYSFVIMHGTLGK